MKLARKLCQWMVLLLGAGVVAAAETAAPRLGDEGVFAGSVLWVTDGDSLRVLMRGQDTEIRLADVDAPEREQAHGWQSKLQLIDLVREGNALIVPRDVDQYGRVVARVWVDGVDINRELVRRGAAWFYPQYAEDESLYQMEQQARNARLGLWTLPVKERIEPWVWRKQQAQRDQSRQRNKSEQKNSRNAR